MSLVKTSSNITDIKGSMAGNTFARDTSGLHVRSKSHRIKQCTAAQRAQRNAFSSARALSKVNREVSYYIYRVLNGLPIDPILISASYNDVTGDPLPDCTGIYYGSGTFLGKPCWSREDDTWFIWWNPALSEWAISVLLGILGINFWTNATGPEGDYEPQISATGTATFTIHKAVYKPYPVPPDYNPPHIRKPKIK